MLFGLNPEYEFLQTTEDYDKEFFSYNIRCTLFRNGQPVAQGVGSCNSKEKKYRFINVDEVPENYIGQSEQYTDKYGRVKYKINNPRIIESERGSYAGKNGKKEKKTKRVSRFI